MGLGLACPHLLLKNPNNNKENAEERGGMEHKKNMLNIVCISELMTRNHATDTYMCTCTHRHSYVLDRVFTVGNVCDTT